MASLYDSFLPQVDQLSSLGNKEIDRQMAKGLGAHKKEELRLGVGLDHSLHCHRVSKIRLSPLTRISRVPESLKRTVLFESHKCISMYPPMGVVGGGRMGVRGAEGASMEWANWYSHPPSLTPLLDPIE